VTEQEHLPILLVEDNLDHEELIRRAFADRGVRVAISVARHGEEALDFLFRRGAFRDPRKSPRRWSSRASRISSATSSRTG
jgi:hypothetical protein